MKIAMIAPIIERVPPKMYGGTERVVFHLTEELVKRGYDVTLFASGDSQTSAKLASVFPTGLRLAEEEIDPLYGPNAYTMMNVGDAYKRYREFDVIHDHNAGSGCGYFSFPAAELISTPVVFTMHGPFSKQDNLIMEHFKGGHVVTISEAQARLSVNLHYAGTVYNGLAMDGYPFSDKPDNYLLYVGRICPEKGTHYAIEVAEKLGLPLIIAAKLDKNVEGYVKYFKEQVEPKLSETIKWVGEVEEEKRNELMSKAIALLHPVAWPEPFGLTLIESMACGCPVVAFHQGSIPEIVQDGRTGFVVGSVEEMVERLQRIGEISRKACRDYSRKQFSVSKMADGYELLYKKITSGKAASKFKPLKSIIKKIQNGKKKSN